MEIKLFTWINDELNNRGWTYSELARRSGLSQSFISMVMNGHRNVTYDFCAAIAKPLDTTPESVFRAAGLLPKMPADDASLKEILEVMRGLTPAERLTVLEFATWRSQQQGKQHGK